MITIEKLNKLKLNLEEYIREKHNPHLYKHTVKYPIDYGKQRYYIRFQDKLLKLKKALGVSYLYQLNEEEEINREELKRLFFQSKAYLDTLKLLQEITPRFHSVSAPKDLLNPSTEKAEKTYDPTIKLSIHWFKSDLIGEAMDPSVFNLVIFDL
jgi:hypothetical protein